MTTIALQCTKKVVKKAARLFVTSHREGKEARKLLGGRGNKGGSGTNDEKIKDSGEQAQEDQNDATYGGREMQGGSDGTNRTSCTRLSGWCDSALSCT